jgi:mannonate dehydratase
MPLFSASGLADKQLLDQSAVPFLQEVRTHNPLLFDFACKRLLRYGDYRFAKQVFETRRLFQA